MSVNILLVDITYFQQQKMLCEIRIIGNKSQISEDAEINVQ